ncbi:DUF1697 domain-containing protein [Chryseobacterium oryzae]|uniref:DUF1697 domain-containing protein n=1 Tax=Chryseobacterium oryzae TaxID=2929799 RepID=A0ABY4BDT9_9FLAO|nr:DUF1697 domain-containing protein [Chryseobacterium oryzae]UOE36914.1 DUF1697 domain-containing protein [Chryseobacterium oryzae]
MKYCAFLRGVNVKGTSMKMAEVCSVFENAGMDNVISVLASGNIIFNSDKTVEDLKVILEKSMSEYFNYEAFLFIKSKEGIEKILNSNPFEENKDFHTYVFVGIENIETVLMKEFQELPKMQDESAEVVNGYFYWQLPKGNTLASQFGKILGKKSLKDKFTSRNLNSFEKIVYKIR